MPTGHRLTKSDGDNSSSSALNSNRLESYGATLPGAGIGSERRKRAWSTPKDHYYLVYIVFFLQGVGMLFPWNVYITASEYFHTRFKGTPFVNNFENIFSFCYSFTNLFFMVILVNYAHLEYFNMQTTVGLPQVLTTCVFAATTVMVEISMTGEALFSVTVGFILLCGFTAALIQSGIFGLAGRFPAVYTQAVMSGQGVAGMSVSIISLVSTLGTPCTGATPSDNEIEQASFSYFLVSTVVILMTLFAFLALTRSDFAQHYAFSEAGGSPRPSGGEFGGEWQEEEENHHGVQDGDALEDALNDALLTPRTRRRIVEQRKSILSAPVFQPSSPDTSAHSSVHGSRSASQQNSRRASKGPSPMATSPHTSGESTPAAAMTNDGGSVTFGEKNENDIIMSSPGTTIFPNDPQVGLLPMILEERMGTCELISYIWRNCFSVMLVFAVTLSVFPGVTSEIRSSTNLKNERCPSSGRFFGAGVWQAVFFLLFNAGDTLGRLAAALRQCVPKKYVFVLSLSRVVFIPLFLACNVVASTPSVTPNGTMVFDGLMEGESGLGYFSEDHWPIIFMCLLSVSNGYVASLEMMNGPTLVPDGQQSRAGTIMAFFLVLGLVMGSMLSFAVRSIACKCNPFVG